ncbi:hypothetical protein ACJJTC_009055 [Scirpophaga incertulas]
MFPIKMLLRTYSLSILMIDIIWVVLNAVYAVMQATFELFRPPPVKAVRLETVLVIGSGRGVGREIAIQLASLGAIVICVDKNKKNNQDTVDIIKKQGGSAACYNCDITTKENVEKLAKKVKFDFGFVNLTLTSYFWLIDQFMPDMKKKNHGHIVALTSVAGLSYIKDQMPLSVAQFAVQGLAESLMEDLRINKIDGVHVTLIHIYPFIIFFNACATFASDCQKRLHYTCPHLGAGVEGYAGGGHWLENRPAGALFTPALAASASLA